MRPSKHKPIVVSYHLFTRKGTYYYRSNVPVDLLQHFPTTEIKKSFKTKESKLANYLDIWREANCIYCPATNFSHSSHNFIQVTGGHQTYMIRGN